MRHVPKVRECGMNATAASAFFNLPKEGIDGPDPRDEFRI